MTAVESLADILHGADREASEIAAALRVKSASVGKPDPSAPSWHPSNPSHPFHDAWQDFGHEMYTHPESDARVVHPLYNREQAEKKAAAVRANPVFVSPMRVRQSEDDSYSPAHPEHRLHDFYLANPAWFHTLVGEQHGLGVGAHDTAVASLYRRAEDPNHPLNESHPDHDHFLVAHSLNKPINLSLRDTNQRWPMTDYWAHRNEYHDTPGGVNVHEPYKHG